MKNVYLSLYFFTCALIILSCNNNFTESQSEIAGYCGVILSTSDEVNVSRMGLSIIHHAGERGFNESGYRRGIKRAINELESQGWSDGDRIELSEQSINDCREVLS